MNLRLKVPPVTEPVTVDDAKTHLRAEEAPDQLLRELITTARQLVEEITSRALLPQTWELGIGAFPDELVLPRPPLRNVASIKYVDPDGATQVLDPSSYVVLTRSEPGRVRPAWGQSWPAARDQEDAVLVEYTAGYDAVPAPVRHAILLTVSALYDQRTEGSVPDAARRLLWPYRILQL